MSSLNEKTKYRVIGRLINSEAPKDIATAEDVPYATVLRLKRLVDEAKQNDKVAELLDLDQVMLDEVLEAIVTKAPAVLTDAVREVATAVSAIKAMTDSLSLELMSTAKVLNSRIRAMSVSAATPGELDMLAESLCKMQIAFFNKNTTQVNIQNNHGVTDGKPYNSFLSDEPEDNA